jgi:hypothetical protein
MFPVFDPLFITLKCLAVRLLAAESDAVQKPADMIPMIAYSKFPFDNLSDTSRSPKISMVSMGHGSLEQKLGQPSFLSRIQPRWAPWRTVHLIDAIAFTDAPVSPTENGTCVTSQATADLVKTQTLVEKFECPAAPIGKNLDGIFWSHTDALLGHQYIAFIMQMSINE